MTATAEKSAGGVFPRSTGLQIDGNPKPLTPGEDMYAPIYRACSYATTAG